MIYTCHPLLFGDQIEKNEMGAARSMYGGRGDLYTGFWRGNLRERDHLEDSGIDDRIIFRRIFRKWNLEAWAGSIWLGIGTGDGHL